jgi:foldase protein PrsA
LKQPILIFCAAATLVALAAFSIRGCKKGDAVAASVNGQAISMDEYHSYLEIKPSVQVVVNPSQLQASGNGQYPSQPYSGTVIGSLGLQAMTDLVQQTVLKQMAEDEKAWPSQAEIESELAERNKANPGFVRELTNRGFTLKMIQNDLALGLAQIKLVTQGITVTDAEVDKYIVEHPKDFEVPQLVDMLWILAPNEEIKKAADADLKSGRDFLTVAQQYSKAPSARENGYRFQVNQVPQLDRFGPELKKSVETLVKNGGGEEQQTGWLKFTEGYAKFYIKKVTPSRKMPIDDVLKKNLRRKMAISKGQQGKDIDQRVRDRMKKADIKILIKSIEEPWKKSMETLKGTPDGAATSGQK